MKYLHDLMGHLPPWAYVAIIGGGIAAAVILPKFFGGTGNQTTASNGSNTTAAIDPTTGLPYPVSGYPGGAFAGGAGLPTNDGQQASSADFAALQATLQQIANELKQPPTTTKPTPTPSPTLTGTKPPVVAPGPSGGAKTPAHVSAQPSQQSIAAAKGSSEEVQKHIAVVNKRLYEADAKYGG